MMQGDDALSGIVIGAAIEVHRVLGPGLLESAYEECLAIELTRRGVLYVRQPMVPVMYKGSRIDACYRADFVLDGMVVEVKAVERMLPVHEAQLLTYMRMLRKPVGLLLNFQTAVLKDGVRRMTLRVADDRAHLAPCAGGVVAAGSSTSQGDGETGRTARGEKPGPVPASD